MTAGVQPGADIANPADPLRNPRRVFWLQGITLGWMSVEFGVAAYAALRAHSPALAAFGSDSFVELLSGVVVLLQFTRRGRISERTSARVAAVLLFVLAAVVAATSLSALALHLVPAESRAGMAIVVAALLVMPSLAWAKRREAGRIGNVALAADAAQSATCAYLALITLLGLAVRAIFHLAWADPAAGLLAIPLLVQEGRSAWREQRCGCC